MRDKFSWRLRPSDTEFNRLWKEAIFVFDTNVLLGFYRLSRSTSNDLLSLLDHLKGRIWLPFQVGNEFFEHREETIGDECNAFQEAVKSVDKWVSEQSSLNWLRAQFNQAGRIVGAEIGPQLEKMDSYIKEVKKTGDEIKSRIETAKNLHAPPSPDSDYILERILTLFEGRVGESYEKKRLEQLYKEAAERYKDDIPPGFKDKDKPGNKPYNDYIIWSQLLEHAKSIPTDVIFVTGERKADWWEMIDNQIKSPHFLLRKEFREITGKEFWMYSPERFLEEAKEHLAIEVKESSIKETIAVSEEEARSEEVTNALEFLNQKSNLSELVRQKFSAGFSLKSKITLVDIPATTISELENALRALSQYLIEEVPGIKTTLSKTLDKLSTKIPNGRAILFDVYYGRNAASVLQWITHYYRSNKPLDDDNIGNFIFIFNDVNNARDAAILVSDILPTKSIFIVGFISSDDKFNLFFCNNGSVFTP